MDYDAVRNGLTLTCSSGAVEGTVTKTKAIKRLCTARAELCPSPGAASCSGTDPPPTESRNLWQSHSLYGHGNIPQPTIARRLTGYVL